MEIKADWAISEIGPSDSEGKIPFYRSHKVWPILNHLGESIDISREHLIDMILDKNKVVITVRNINSEWVQGEVVNVTRAGYLRTNPNDIQEDNLGELPVARKRIINH